MKNELQSFIDFIREKGVVALAVGLAIGIQVTSLVNTIVDGLIDPIVGFLLGTEDGLLNATWTLTSGDRSMVIQYGAILSGLITLVAVAAVIYYSIKFLKLDKLDKAKKED